MHADLTSLTGIINQDSGVKKIVLVHFKVVRKSILKWFSIVMNAQKFNLFLERNWKSAPDIIMGLNESHGGGQLQT